MKFRPKLLVAKSFKVLFLTYRYEFSLLNAILFIKICFEDLVQHENKRYYLISSTKAMIILCILHSSLLSLICGNKFRRNRVLVSHVGLNFVSAILFINIFSAYLSWLWDVHAFLSLNLRHAYQRLLITLSSYSFANAVISSTLFLSSLFRLISKFHRIRNQHINSRNDWELSPNEFICLNNLCMDCPLCLLSILFIPRQTTELHKQTSHLAAFLVFNSDQSSSFDFNFCNRNKRTIECGVIISFTLSVRIFLPPFENLFTTIM